MSPMRRAPSVTREATGLPRASPTAVAVLLLNGPRWRSARFPFRRLGGDVPVALEITGKHQVVHGSGGKGADAAGKDCVGQARESRNRPEKWQSAILDVMQKALHHRDNVARGEVPEMKRWISRGIVGVLPAGNVPIRQPASPVACALVHRRRLAPSVHCVRAEPPVCPKVDAVPRIVNVHLHFETQLEVATLAQKSPP